jgi:hypothetical protein
MKDVALSMEGEDGDLDAFPLVVGLAIMDVGVLNNSSSISEVMSTSM